MGFLPAISLTHILNGRPKIISFQIMSRYLMGANFRRSDYYGTKITKICSIAQPSIAITNKR